MSFSSVCVSSFYVSFSGFDCLYHRGRLLLMRQITTITATTNRITSKTGHAATMILVP